MQNENKYFMRIKNGLTESGHPEIDVADFFANGITDINYEFKESTDCLCGHPIEKNFIVKYNGVDFIMGSCCIKRFGIKVIKKCHICKSEYHTNNMKRLKLCRKCRRRIPMFQLPWKYKDQYISLVKLYEIDIKYFYKQLEYAEKSKDKYPLYDRLTAVIQLKKFESKT